MQLDVLLQRLASPAQRALQNAGITTVEQLLTYSEADLLSLHGFGKNALATIKQTLAENGLTLADKR